MYTKDPLALQQESIWRSNDSESINNEQIKKDKSKSAHKPNYN